jgi:hypothetical protein
MSTVYNGTLTVSGGLSAISWDSNRIDLIGGGTFNDMWHTWVTTQGSSFPPWESPEPGHG